MLKYPTSTVRTEFQEGKKSNGEIFILISLTCGNFPGERGGLKEFRHQNT